jgi:hypothetical protein
MEQPQMGIQEQFSEKTVCPITAKEVIATQFVVEPILGGLAGIAAWWPCSACQCWHLSEVKPIEARVEHFLSPQQIMPHQLN